MLLLAIPGAVQAQSFLRVPVTTLGGASLLLPGALRQTDAFLVIGFTQRSERETVVWRKRIERDFATNRELSVYPVIVVAGIPRIFRGLIIAGIRAGYPRNAWDHFLVVSEDEAKWKDAVDWQGPDRAYLLLLDRKGGIAWRASGPFTVAEEQSLASAISRLGASRS